MFNLSSTALVVSLVLLTIGILILPLSIRSLQGNNSLIGAESYYSLGLAQNILQPGSYPISEQNLNAFHYLLAGATSISSPSLAGKLVPILLGALTALVLFAIQRKLSDNDIAAMSVLLAVSSPLFIIVFTTLNQLSLITFLGVLSWWLLLYQPRILPVSLTALLIIDTPSFFVASLLLLVQALFLGRHKIMLIILGIGIFIAGLLAVFIPSLVTNIELKPRGFAELFLSLDSGYGFSIFLLILGIAGVIGLWRGRNNHIFALLTFIAVFIISLFHSASQILFVIPIAVFAAFGITDLIKKMWTIPHIKQVTLLFIVLSLLFTSVLAVIEQSEREPQLPMLQALQFLRTVPEGEVVLSHADNGILIRRIARQPAFIDHVSQDNLGISEEMFSVFRVKDADRLLDEYNITHILVDQDMINGKTWSYKDQGLLFLLENNKNSFVEIYNKGGVSIYRVISRS